MKRQFPALLLALSLLLSIPAQAAQTDGFQRIRTYDGAFSDLTPDSVFYDNAVALYEYGLTNGKSDGTFGPGDSITLGQAVIFAGRIRGLYQTGDAEAALAYRHETTPGALAYLRYLQAEGALEADFVGDYMDFYEPASRAQVAHVLAKVLPEEALPSINSEKVAMGYTSRRFITDVDEYTPYYQDILDLYRKGVAGGSGAAGDFRPEEPITRGPPPPCSPAWWTPPCGSSSSGTCRASTAPPGPLWRTWWSPGPTASPPPPRRSWRAPSASCWPRGRTRSSSTTPSSPRTKPGGS